MHPILVKSGFLTVYSYGVMVAIGFVISAMLIYRRAEKFGLNKDKCIDLVILVLIAGIAGARLLYVLLNLAFYRANPLEIIMLSKGGLVWYGGFLAAFAAALVYTKLNSINLWSVLDLLAPYVALGQAFGRIGCFLNGCCYGLKVAPGFPLSVTFPCDADPRLPAQLISAAGLFLIFIVLLIWQNRRRFGSEIFLGYCILYSAKRFNMEFLRGDNPKILFGLTFSQLVSAGIFIAALAIFIIKVRQWKKISAVSK